MADLCEPTLCIGLISGTSLDGIDAVLVEPGDRCCTVAATLNVPYEHTLRADLLQASRHASNCDADEVGRLDQRVGVAFRDAALALLADSNTKLTDVRVIGSHGQTLRHLPRDRHPFTLQIGDPNIIAAGTGITTVADFRRRDLALGGEGAPLAPAFHQWLWGDAREDRVVLNLGGFANVTLLPTDGSVTGFDTGPANSLLDAWCQRHTGAAYDNEGRFAASGECLPDLLAHLLNDPWFALPPPKSTGFEYFNLDWLDARLAGSNYQAADVQRTLCELSAQSIAAAIRAYAPVTMTVMVCGGGAHNPFLLERLAAALPGVNVESTAAAGIDPDWVEAATFAWLATRCLDGLPGNLPSVTGASGTTVLGAIFPGHR